MPMTYTNQPTDNIDAWRLGDACRKAANELKCGDLIDRGLILLRELEARGYGAVKLKATPCDQVNDGFVCGAARRGGERLYPDCNPRHRPNHRQIVYALERQARACVAQAEALERPGDPYAGLMLREDAELLTQAIALLRAL